MPKNFPMSIIGDTILQKETYFIQKNRFAIHGPLPSTLNLPILYKLDKEQITVLTGSPEIIDTFDESLIWTPVYGHDDDDLPAVPTGWVFIELEEGKLIEKKRELLLEKRFSIQEILKYAPHCAWLVSDRGDIAEALNHMPDLMQIPDVVNVKPQLLRPRSFK
jgi:hypothetical protein